MSMAIPTSVHQVVLQNYTSQGVDLSFSPTATFAVRESPLPSPLLEDSLLVQMLYLSNDPGIRILLRHSIKYTREEFVTLPLGTPFPVFATISRVVQVGGGDGPFKVGDIVEVGSYWADYAVVKKDKARPRKSEYEPRSVSGHS